MGVSVSAQVGPPISIELLPNQMVRFAWTNTGPFILEEIILAVNESREHTHAIESVARRQRVEFTGRVAEAGYVTRERVPVGRLQVGIEVHPISFVRERTPKKYHVGS